MQPLGCNLRTYGQEEHPDYAFQALLGVDTIGGQLLPSIFAEADSVPTSQVLTYCVNVQIIICKILYLCSTPGIYKFIVDIRIFGNFPDLTKLARLLTCTCMREACTEYLEKLINIP